MKKDLFTSIILTISLLIFLNSFVSEKKTVNQKNENIISEITESQTLYGLAIDSFIIDEVEVKPNFYISELFSKYNLTTNISEEILTKSKGLFDVKKIQIGKKFKVFKSKDSSQTVEYIVYEQSPEKYIVFDLLDSINVFLGENDVRTELKTGSGVISSCLWNVMTDNNLNPLLANDLSDIYAWTIDFFGLQEGDKFKIIYETQFVDTIEIGYGKIKAAYFEHYGKQIYAIPFYQDSLWSFFNTDGESLRKAFLKAPLKYSHIASGYSNSRLHPILKIYRAHHGVDYSAPAGTPVYTIGDGIVTEASYGSQSGNYIYIKHNGVYQTGYLHLSKFEEGIHVGSLVKQGEVIGYVGSTGLSTGPHLDFRVWMNGQPINPLTIDAPPVDPIKEENKAKFAKISAFIVENLDKIEYNYSIETK